MKKLFKENTLRFLIWFFSAAALVTVDQITKILAVNNLRDAPKENFIPFLFNLVYTENEGAAWGIFADQRWVFISVSSVAIIMLTAALFYYANEHKLLCISLTLILAGGVGNMIDRLSLGYVVDFIQFAFFTAFPIFNGADSYVTVGGVMMICYIIFKKDNVFFKDKKKTEKNES